MHKTIIDDNFQSYLTEDAVFEGEAGIPCLFDFKNVDIPKSLIAFNKIKKNKDKHKYVHFYINDILFSKILTSTKSCINILKEYDGVITPDPTIVVGKSKCLAETSTYLNRAIGFYLQKNGISVIPNVRWGDETTYDFCFLGIPKHSIVSISTLGCIMRNKDNNNLLRNCFKKD